MPAFKSRFVWVALAVLVGVVVVRDTQRGRQTPGTSAQRRAEWHLDGIRTAKVVLVTADTRSITAAGSHLGSTATYTFLYTLCHPEHRMVFYRPTLVHGDVAHSPLEDCHGTVQAVRGAHAFGHENLTIARGPAVGLAGPDGCVLGAVSWAQVPALQAAHASFPDADYIVWHDGDAVIHPDYFDQSLHEYLAQAMPLDNGPPEKPVMLNLEQGNWWCSQTIKADASCFNVGLIVLHGHADPRVTQFLDAWWHTSVESQDTEPDNIKQRVNFMGNSKGLTMAAHRDPYRSWVMRAPPGIEDPATRTAVLATEKNGFNGLWRFEGPPYNEAKPKGTNMASNYACDLLHHFFPITKSDASWIGSSQLWAECAARATQQHCGVSHQDDKVSDTLLQSCIRWLRPIPAACLVGMPNFGCLMMHFYSNPTYKRWWSDQLTVLIKEHVAHASVCDGKSPLAGTRETCELFRSVFDPVQFNSSDAVIAALASQIERTVTVELPIPDWATRRAGS